MSDFGGVLQAALMAMSWIETAAVLLGVIYLLLAMRENILCWYAAFISTALSIYIFWDVDLLMESALQIYYLVMAVYGWYQWKYGAGSEQQLEISCWRLRTHLAVLALVLGCSALSGYLLTSHSQAAWPYLDSFTTWGSIVTTYMVARKILENWIYWLVIDSLSIFLYLDRGLYLYALLFMVYIVIVICGLLTWTRHYQIQGQNTLNNAT